MTNVDDAKGLLTPLANRCRISNTSFTLHVMCPEDSCGFVGHFEKGGFTGDTSQWRHNGQKASQITIPSIVCSTVCSGADKRKHQSSLTDLCEGNLPVTGEFPSQWASNAENVSIWWRHHYFLIAISNMTYCFVHGHPCGYHRGILSSLSKHCILVWESRGESYHIFIRTTVLYICGHFPKGDFK